MSVPIHERRARVVPALLAGLVVLGPGLVRAADKLDKDSKKWLDGVRAIILPEEERTFRDLSDKSDRDEFRKIFWARRDPNIETPVNEYQAEFDKVRAEADNRFRVPGRNGSETDCGRVYILLGPPDQARQGDATRDTMATRLPETWAYRDKPGMKFTGGQVQLNFDENCDLPQGGRLGEQLNRIAEAKVANPNLQYRVQGGHLVKLADQLPKPSPMLTLLKTPRQDFPVKAQTGLVLRGPNGGAYLAGLVRAEAGAIPVHDAGGSKTAKVVVGVEAKDETGKVVASSERDSMADVAADGSLVASYGMAVKPGSYTLQVAVLDPASGKGSVTTDTVKTPDFTSEEMSLSPVLVLREIEEKPGNPQDAYASYQLGPMRFLPRFDNVFAASDSVTLIGFVYNPKTDETTGKPSITSSFSILKDGKPVARSDDQNYDTPGAGPSVGPVPLAKYGTGKYLVQFKVRDNVAKKDYNEEARFEVK
jgi:GWxTD domain-containing protein